MAIGEAVVTVKVIWRWAFVVVLWAALGWLVGDILRAKGWIP
jgi:hypothetical protein